MSKVGRPSKAKKKLKDGFYMHVTIKNSNSPIRIMRETKAGLEDAREQFKNNKFKYLGQVKNNVWLDGENKGKKTN